MSLGNLQICLDKHLFISDIHVLQKGFRLEPGMNSTYFTLDLQIPWFFSKL